MANLDRLAALSQNTLVKSITCVYLTTAPQVAEREGLLGAARLAP
jgi:hypothetical protein